MRAKKKSLEIKKPEDYGVEIKKRLEVLKTEAPAARSAGIKVETVDELIQKLKDEEGVI